MRLGVSLALPDDVLPADERTASRTQHPDWWTGDVWKMIPALRKYRQKR